MANLQPKTKNQLQELIAHEIDTQGQACSLNHIDVSRIEDMSELFQDSLFNGDISKWNTSNITDMDGMFQESKFHGDLRSWKKSNEALREMFQFSYKDYVEKRKSIEEHGRLVDIVINNVSKKQTNRL